MTMKHSHLSDMEMLATKRLIPNRFELGTNIELAELVYALQKIIKPGRVPKMIWTDKGK